MGKCPSCGHKDLFLDKYNCQMCGKEGCQYCMMPLFWSSNYRIVVCSEGCWNDFLEKIKAVVDKNINVPPYTTVDGKYITETLEFAYRSYKDKNPEFPKTKDKKLVFADWIFDYDTYKGREPPYEGQFPGETAETAVHYVGEHDPWGSSYRLFYALYEHLVLNEARNRENLLIGEAKHCEKVGRYGDAAEKYKQIAELYEQQKLHDKARVLRDKARHLLGKEKQVIVKTTDIVVDLNKLIEQVKDGGIVVVYRCPHCGGKLKIGKDTSVESLRVCEHCGSAIKAMDLTDFLQTALS